jgi:hypothetical protein
MSGVSARLLVRRVLAPLLLMGAPLAWLGTTAPPAGAVTVLTVTTNADSGFGSLRAAMTTALTTTDDAEIDVNAGLGTITLASALPPYNGGGTTHNLTVKGNGVTIVGFAGTNVFDTTGGGVGGMSLDGMTISGGQNGVDTNAANATITLTNSTVTGSSHDGVLGGDGLVTIRNSTISGVGNDGILNGAGALMVINSLITGSNNYGIDAGNNATVTLTGSTLSANANGAVGSGNGSTTNVVNSTVVNNADTAVASGSNSHENIAYSTITGNGDGFAQIGAGTGNTLTMFGSVVTSPANSSPNCAFGSNSTTVSQGYNYAGDATCSLTQATDRQSAGDPLLGTLGANGGPTPTELPKPGSPLIDAIATGACRTGLAATVTSDQRGITRPQGPGCDIGALEVVVANQGHVTTGGSDIAATPDGAGYWTTVDNGGVFTHGNAQYYGSLGGQPLGHPISGMAATPNGGGYWLVGTDGGVFGFGNAQYHGSLPGIGVHPNGPIVGIVGTPDGGGYWLVGRDGGVFGFGNAQYHGSLGGQPLNSPISGMAALPDGTGYWLVGGDGGVFGFGNAQYHGSLPGSNIHPNAPIYGIASTLDGGGYWLIGTDGGVFAYPNAGYYGSLGGGPSGAVIGLISTPSGHGYNLIGSGGGATKFGT